MAAADFDSSKYAKRLQNAGETQEAAKVHAEVVGDVAREVAANTADIKQLRSENNAGYTRLEAKVDRVEAKVDRVEAKVDRVEAKVDKRMDLFEQKLEQFKQEIKQELSLEIGKAFAEMRAEVMRWNIALAAIIVAAITAINKLFP